MSILNKIFKSYSEKEVKRIMSTVEKINSLEDEISKLTDTELENGDEISLQLVNANDIAFVETDSMTYRVDAKEKRQEKQTKKKQNQKKNKKKSEE